MVKNKKKTIAATLAVVILIGGTYAWQAFDQRVTNETAGVDGNVGVRLHNDFNGENADVYVENFASETGTVAYTRVRVQEYMEIGYGAGYLSADESELADDKSVDILVGDKSTGSTADIDNPETWDIFLYEGSSSNTIRQYVTVGLGDITAPNKGATVYLPTFNKDFDNKDADIKGTLLGSSDNRYDGASYDDYTTYTVGEMVNGNATYNIYSDEAIKNNNNIINEDHVAQYTETATVMSMSEWNAAGSPVGSYWVFDTDGWAYWANGIAPQSATGLLVDGVRLVIKPDANYHYGLHVVSESYTANDWGVQGGGATEEGVYAEGITSEALALLDIVVDYVQNPPYIINNVTMSPTASSVTVGSSLNLNISVATDETDVEASKLILTIEEAVDNGDASSISLEALDLSSTIVDGVFTPVEGMGGKTYTITATSEHDDTKSASVDITVVEGGDGDGGGDN